MRRRDVVKAMWSRNYFVLKVCPHAVFFLHFQKCIQVHGIPARRFTWLPPTQPLSVVVPLRAGMRTITLSIHPHSRVDVPTPHHGAFPPIHPHTHARDFTDEKRTSLSQHIPAAVQLHPIRLSMRGPSSNARDSPCKERTNTHKTPPHPISRTGFSVYTDGSPTPPHPPIYAWPLIINARDSTSQRARQHSQDAPTPNTQDGILSIYRRQSNSTPRRRIAITSKCSVSKVSESRSLTTKIESNLRTPLPSNSAYKWVLKLDLCNWNGTHQVCMVGQQESLL